MSDAYHIRDGSISLGKCQCCDQDSIFITNYIFEGGAPRGAYVAYFTNGHQEKGVHMALTVGDWSEDASNQDRHTFLMDLWQDKTHDNVRFMDWHGDVWQAMDFPGIKHDRDAALSHKQLDQLYLIKDHIIAKDGIIRRFFEQGYVQLRQRDKDAASSIADATKKKSWLARLMARLLGR